MLYVLYALPANALLGVATTESELPPAPANSVTKALPEWADVPPAPYTWNAALANFAIPRSDAPSLTQQEFMDRWEAAGLGAVLDLLFTLEVANSPQGSAARKWLTRFRTARGIDPADPRTIAGTDDLCALGVAAGVVTTAQVTAGRPIVLAAL